MHKPARRSSLISDRFAPNESTPHDRRPQSSPNEHEHSHNSYLSIDMAPLEIPATKALINDNSVQPIQMICDLKPVPTDLSGVVAQDDSMLTLLSDVTRERHNLIDARARIATQQNDIAVQLPLDKVVYQEMLAVLSKSMPEILASGISAEIREILTEKWTQFGRLTKTLDDWQTRVEKEKNDLIELESKLWSKENDLYMRLSKLRQGPLAERASKLSDSYAASIELDYSNDAQSSASSEDPDEENYYEAIGQINLLRDRLFNLESSLTQARLQNEGTGKGSATDLHRTFTLEDHMRDRQQIIVDYFKNKKAMEDSAKRCLEKRIEVEPPNLPPDLDRIFTRAQNEFLDADKQTPSAGDASQSHVEQWLHGVLQSGPSGAGDLAGTSSALAETLPNPATQAEPVLQSPRTPVFGSSIVPGDETFSEPDLRRVQMAQASTIGT